MWGGLKHYCPTLPWRQIVSIQKGGGGGKQESFEGRLLVWVKTLLFHSLLEINCKYTKRGRMKDLGGD